MPKFGCKTGVHLGVFGVFSCLKSTHPPIFLYCFGCGVQSG